MLYHRNIGNKEIGRKIWKTCRAFNNNVCGVERFVLRWMNCATLNDLYSVELFVHRSVICTTLSDLYYVEWFLKTCATLNDSYSFERIVLRWMVRSVMDDLYKEESCGLGCLLNIGLLMSARCDYSRNSTYFILTSELIFPWYENIKKK